MTPQPKTVRFVGGTRPRFAPFGSAWADADDGEALAVQLPHDASANEAAAHIPEAVSLPSGTWVIVLPDPARGRGLLASFGRKPIARASRAGALLLRGYIDLGAAMDPRSKMDLVYGRVP